MDRAAIIGRLKAREPELRGLGLARLSLFGSTARGEAGPGSDVDLAATFDVAARVDMFRFAAIEHRLRELVGAPVDLVGEPARKAAMQAEIDRDRVLVF